ncbi:MAG: YIP1 family protein [Gammaproteobacteria bacterium]|nr:YIP1 family protein [Gammaproteobacteria bacterium]MYD81612.1 YIP1 family protein [Gammaproteobacteria bacterium]
MNRYWKILISPRSLFDQFRMGIPILLPLVLVLLSGGIYVGITAYFTDDQTYKGHLQDHASAQSEIDVLPEETLEHLQRSIEDPQRIDEARRSATFVAPLVYAITFTIGLVLLASYYWLAGLSFETRIGWASWFGFTCWAAMPTVYGSVITAALISSLGIEWKNALSPLTWIGWTQPWAVLFTIPLVWIVFISVHGLRSWGNKRIGTSVIVVLVPYLVYVLIGSFFMGIPAIVA